MVNTIFILDEYYKTQKVLSVNGANTFFDDLYMLDLSTGVESYEFSTNITDIDESNYIMFYYQNQYKLFQITEIEQEHEDGQIITYCYGESACLELLNGVVRAFSGEFNCIAFFEHVLANTGWSIGNYSSTLADKVMNIKVDKTTQIWSCIQDHMSVFNYELNTRVIYDNGYLKAKLIDIFIEGELGTKTYKRFEYGRNVKGITKKKDLYDWCTALIIKSEKEIVDVSFNEDGYVKEKGSDVILAPTENEIYNLGRNYIYASYEDDSPSAQEAIKNAAAELKRRATPRFDYECDTILTYKEYEDMSIGDTVYVIDHSFSPMVTLEARVGKLEISFTDRNNCKCNLTNYKEVKSGIDVTLSAGIKDIVNTYFPITSAGIADGAIIDGKIDTKYYEQITADIISGGKVVTEQLIAERAIIVDAEIENLYAEDARIENLTVDNMNAINANIQNINAANANIGTLTANVADIQTLINGNLTSDNIQSLNLTSKNTTIENALIKDAMIDTISANKINTGTINTNNVTIQSEDGGISISDETMQFKDGDTVRIQIGKDASGDFTFALYDKTGKGQLINADGIQSSDAIADGLIRNDHVSDNANISGSKLDINSVINVINNDGTETLKGSKIKLDDQNQTLDIAFNTMTTKVDDNTEAINDNAEAINTQSTQISVMQGEISTLITDTTIDGEKLKDKYMSTSTTVDGLVTKVGSLETNYKATLKTSSVQYYLSTSETSLSGGSWSDTAPQWVNGKYMWQRMKYTYTDNVVTYGSASCVAGAKGDTGATGPQGVQGLAGKDGATYYTWIKYADNASGSGLSNDPTGKQYIGFAYNKTTPTESNTASDYTWSKIVGEKGDQGVQGPQGANGTTYYTWIKYSDNSDGTGLYDTPKSSTKYIGIATNKTTASESTNKSDYIWSLFKGDKGDQGIQGPSGEKGQSLTSSTPQWYLSTSNTSQTGGSWVETMPAIADGKYMWLRYKLVWANPTATTYSTPTLEQVAESVKVVSSKQATLEQNLDGFKTTVSSTYATKDALTGEVNTLSSNISKVEQTANKINWLVKSGDSQSNMTLTDKTYDLVSKNITLTADRINLHGYVTANGGFSIDTNGNMTAKNGSFTGNISGSTFSSNNDEFKVLEDGTVKSESLVIDNLIRTHTLNVDDINNPEYPKVMHRATTVYISISEMLAYAPRNLNGYTLSITLNSDINENVTLSWFHSGQVNFNFNGYTVNGYVYCYGASMVYRLYGGVDDDSKVGKIMPYTGRQMGSYYYNLVFQYCQFAVNNISVYPDKVNTTNSGGICANRGARGCIFLANVVGDMRYLVRSEYGSHVYVSKTTGQCNNATFCASTGGIISINNDNTQAGRSTSGNPYWTGSGGMVVCNQVLGMDKITFSSTGNSGSNNNTNTNNQVTVTETVKSTSADTYRSTVYNNWKGDGTVRQGDYGYGDCQGCWFFGNDLYNTMNAGTVIAVVIRIQRQSGGVNAAQTMTVKAHNHGSKPSGAPVYTDTIGTCSCAVGSYIDLIIKDTATINKLKACKGIGLSIGSTSSPYIVCSGSCQVKITYKTSSAAD